MRNVAVFISCWVCVLSVGCRSDAVLEDRTIQFGDSGTTSFQHGASGVYIDDGAATRLIFEPDDSVLATSTPEWSPDRTAAIFATATALNGEITPEQTADWNATPDGRAYLRRAVRYAVWLHDTTEPDAEPTRIFEADCGHEGYVAANLAIRWTHDGKGILFVSSEEPGQHRLLRRDLATGETEPAFPHAARAIVFDYIPQSNRLAVCIEGHKRDGLWIECPGADWWRAVSGRGATDLRLTTASLRTFFSAFLRSGSPLERLRGLMPAWTPDGKRFAVTTCKEHQATPQFQLHTGSLDEQVCAIVLDSDTAISDVRWHPDGSQLALIRYDGVNGSLHGITPEGEDTGTFSDRRLHQFAGWNPTGSELAFVSTPAAEPPPAKWAFALLPSFPGREALVVSDSTGEREVFSGTRITFPNWSPDGSRISFWATVTPRYRSWISFLTGVGLPNGDPAATIDVATGELRWMPVSGLEKLQIGHYYLLRNDLEQAMAWYEDAQDELPELTPANNELLTAAALFRSLCLRRLDRNEAADEALAKFLHMAETPPAGRPQSDPVRLLLAARSEKGRRLARWMFAVEVCLCIDATDECRQILEDAINSESSVGTERLAQLIALSQVLLVAEDAPAYTHLVTNELLPLALSELLPEAERIDQVAVGKPMLFAAQLSVVPLFCNEFLAALDPAVIDATRKRLTTLRESLEDDTGKLIVDRMLAACCSAVGDARELVEIEERIETNPRRSALSTEAIQAGVDEYTKALEQLLAGHSKP